MLQDILVFVVEFLKQQSLKRCAEAAGIDYKKSSVDWANFIRDLFKQYVFEHYSTIKLAGEVEVDESLFGRKVKYHRGEKVGKDVWVMGLVERANNKILVFPVEDRSEDTLLPIILNFVRQGSSIYSDGWSAYINLNEHGFYHFTVLHKETFKKTYVDTQTGEPVEVHTNTIEGAWAHFKLHFKKIFGTKVTNFEAHLAEIVWRNHHSKHNVFEAFFDLLKSIYALESDPKLNFQHPIFRSWTVNEHDEIERVECIGEEISEKPTPASASASPWQQEDKKGITENNSDYDITVSEAVVRKRRNVGQPKRGQSQKKGKVTKKRAVCPANYTYSEMKESGKSVGKGKSKSKRSNPYSKGAFKWDFSDSDFE